MYEMLLIYDDIAEPDVLEDVMTVLSDTEWSVNLDSPTNITKKKSFLSWCMTRWCRSRMSDIETVRAHRNQLCDWLEVPRPQLLTKVS